MMRTTGSMVECVGGLEILRVSVEFVGKVEPVGSPSRAPLFALQLPIFLLGWSMTPILMRSPSFGGVEGLISTRPRPRVRVRALARTIGN